MHGGGSTLKAIRRLAIEIRGKACSIALAAAGLAVPLLLSASAAFPADKPAKPDTSRSETSPISISARAISGFDRSDGTRVTFGQLTWRGGLVLSSADSRFGGWSGLAVDADGGRLLAVSDAGTWMTASLTYAGPRLTGIGDAVIGPIKARDGGRLKRDRDRDAEAVLLSEGSLRRGRVVIAFEQNHRIGIFDIGPDGLSAPLRYRPVPADARRMRALKGFEAVAELRGGRRKGALLAIAEHLKDGSGHHSAWLSTRGGWERLALTDIGGFDPTDAVSLPDGDVIVLERRFRWLEGVKMRLRRIAAHDLAPGAVLQGEVLLEADMGFEIDNMEALSVHKNARGETILSLMSDDNFNGFLQRTVLLQFALADSSERLREARH